MYQCMNPKCPVKETEDDRPTDKPGRCEYCFQELTFVCDIEDPSSFEGGPVRLVEIGDTDYCPFMFLDGEATCGVKRKPGESEFERDCCVGFTSDCPLSTGPVIVMLKENKNAD